MGLLFRLYTMIYCQMTDQDAEDAYNEMVRQEQEQMMTQSQEELGRARRRSSPQRTSGSDSTKQQVSETPIRNETDGKQHCAGVSVSAQ